MSNPLPPPTLNYIGSCDTSQIAGGTVLFSIIFDASINFLMAEYLLQVENSATVPSNLISGFLHTETCVQSGIANQYTIPIPVAELDPETTYTVKVRIYDASTGNATPWSNILDMNLPPPQPAVYGAYYDTIYGYNNDVLYVIFESTFDALNEAIIAYYYTDLDNVVQWKITEPVSVTLVPGDTKYYVQIALAADASLNQPIYVAANAAYSWVVNYNHYYAISEVSDTVMALPAVYQAPVLDPLEYNIYNPVPQETMTLTWSPPLPANLEIFIVDYYIASKYVKIGDDFVFDSSYSVPGNLNTTTISVADNECNQVIGFTVAAVSTSGITTDDSNMETLNIFKYSAAPANLEIGYAFRTGDNLQVDVQCAFQNPLDTGCGDPVEFQCQLTSVDGSALYGDAQYVDYSETSTGYVVRFNNISVPLDQTAIKVVVSLSTLNTNAYPSGALYGATASDTFVFTSVPVITDIDLSGNIITFKVSTPTLLNEVNNVVLSRLALNQLTYYVQNWNADEQPDPVQEFPLDQDVGVWVYHVTLTAVSLLPNRLILVNASNGAGIGHSYIELPIIG
jgi:hypothetical protein